MKINRTTYRTVEMLKAISSSENGISLKEIIDIMDIPRTSAFDILQTLVMTNMVQETETKLYKVGLTSFEIGYNYIKKTDALSVISQELKKLSFETKRTSFYGVLDGTDVMYLYKYEPENTAVTSSII